MNFKATLLAAFREIFVPRHRSLEFRAKVFSAMLLALKKVNKSHYELIEQIGNEIYANDPKRAKLLVALTREYVAKANIYRSLNLDSLLKDIDNTLKNQKYFSKKIDFSYLRRLISKDDDEALLQMRVYEFLIDETKRYPYKK